MPIYVEADKDYAHTVDYTVNGQLVTPASATYTIRDNAGAVVDSLEDQTITIAENATSTVISIPAAANDKTLAYELRYVEVSFVYDGSTYNIVDHYVIRDDLRFPLTRDQVRAVLGLSSSELPDDSVDIYRAYGLVEDDVGDEANLTTILTGGTSSLPDLIDAVKYKAASLIVGTIEAHMMQSEQADNTLYRRFENIDFEKLRKEISGLYSLALNKILGVTTPTTPTLSLLATGTDVITNQ